MTHPSQYWTPHLPNLIHHMQVCIKAGWWLEQEPKLPNMLITLYGALRMDLVLVVMQPYFCPVCRETCPLHINSTRKWMITLPRRWWQVTSLANSCHGPGKVLHVNRIGVVLCLLEYTCVDKVAGAALSLQKESLLAKIDIKSAYCLVSVYPQHRPSIAGCVMARKVLCRQKATFWAQIGT